MIFPYSKKKITESQISFCLQTVPASRDAWVLTLMTIVVDKLSDEAQSEIGGILGRVFEPTLSMITDDFTNYPVFLFDF